MKKSVSKRLAAKRKCFILKSNKISKRVKIEITKNDKRRN